MAGRKLSRPTDHRLALYRNLISDLFRYEKIVTTEAKAKEIKGQAEKLITLGKRGDLHARRLALTQIYDSQLVDKLFHVIAPRYGERPGGYTRVIKLGPRHGDAAPMAQIQLVE
ncbi:MAG: 50S ribosomal protein L17 [Dehalococcoidales bacterium]|nr:50S ribosomal protein L17 [Dehalococcoidales bacterium]